MDTDEALARALNEVLSLSGGDPRKVPPGAMDALNARVTARVNRGTSSEVSSPATPRRSLGKVSSTVSTVTSPTTTSRSLEDVSPSISTVISPTSHSLEKVSSRGKIGPVPAHARSPSKVSFTPKKSEKPRLNPDPDLVLLPDVTSVFRVASTQSPQLPIAYDNLSHPTWMELFPDVKDDIFYTSPSATSHHLPPSGPRVEDHAPTTLHPVLAEIQHDESRLPLSDFIGLKRVIEANPYYLGEPYHINVRNSQGSLKNRRMKRPPPGSPTPEKWFAVARGSELGVFLDWLVVNPLVTGKSRSNFKSFRDEYEACVWLQACLLRGTLELIN
ncbi:hypothetical protein BJ322DRAFT_1016940 [Thelephora terrestris]|uniref:Ribonuclease H1 N-terminal domain-containing protein n=1 Tax=Thelephora terrestris TaxID=56493 RepID=A0A9P6HV25_9AGAM|nr:hypothetical protein BJ322DRAFT_1016940 [Thelephora terrestris]